MSGPAMIREENHYYLSNELASKRNLVFATTLSARQTALTGLILHGKFRLGGSPRESKKTSEFYPIEKNDIRSNQVLAGPQTPAECRPLRS